MIHRIRRWCPGRFLLVMGRSFSWRFIGQRYNPVHHYNLLNRVQIQVPRFYPAGHPIDIKHHWYSHPFEHDSQD